MPNCWWKSPSLSFFLSLEGTRIQIITLSPHSRCVLFLDFATHFRLVHIPILPLSPNPPWCMYVGLYVCVAISKNKRRAQELAILVRSWSRMQYRKGRNRKVIAKSYMRPCAHYITFEVFPSLLFFSSIHLFVCCRDRLTN